jgi:hypothetical protein
MDLVATQAESQALAEQPEAAEAQGTLRLNCRCCCQWKPPAEGRHRGELFLSATPAWLCREA